MKKHLLIILLIISGDFIQAQTTLYNTFPTIDGFWHQKDNGSHYQFGIMGDTVINNLTWSKIYLQNNCNINPVMTSVNSTFVGGLREDSLKRIFFYAIGNTSIISPFLTPNFIYKLYDFSAQTGDTIHFQNSSHYNAPYYIVDNTDSVYTYNQYRKRFHLSSPGFFTPETWIEGIGSLRALFSIITPQPTCSCYTDLFCFKSNNISYYIKTPYQDCYSETVGISEFQKKQEEVTVFPNPFEEVTTINFNHYVSDLSIIIYNELGQQIKQINHNCGMSITLKSEGLNDGMYYCYFKENNNTNAVQKIIVKRK